MSQSLITNFFINRKSNSIKKGSELTGNEDIKVLPPDIKPAVTSTSQDDVAPVFKSPPRTSQDLVQSRRLLPSLPKFDFEKKPSLRPSYLQRSSDLSRLPSMEGSAGMDNQKPLDKPEEATETRHIQKEDRPGTENIRNSIMRFLPSGEIELNNSEIARKPPYFVRHVSLKTKVDHPDDVGVIPRLMMEAHKLEASQQKSRNKLGSSFFSLSIDEPSCNAEEIPSIMANEVKPLDQQDSTAERWESLEKEIGIPDIHLTNTKEERLKSAASLAAPKEVVSLARNDKKLSNHMIQEEASSKPLAKEEENGIPDALLDSLLNERDDPIPQICVTRLPGSTCDSPRGRSYRKHPTENVDLLCDETLHDDTSAGTPKKTERQQDGDAVFKVPLIPKPKPSPSRSPQSPLKTPFLSPVRKKLSLSPKSPSSPKMSPRSKSPRFARGSPSSSLTRNYSRSFLSKASYSILNSPTSSKGSPSLLSSPKSSPYAAAPPTSPVISRRLFSSPHSSPASRRQLPNTPESSPSGTSKVRKSLFPSQDHLDQHEPTFSPKTKRPSYLDPSEYQSPKKKNKVAEVQTQLKTCNSLAQLQQRLISLQGFQEDLESIQQASPVKLHLTPTKSQQHPTPPISSPILSRKKKSFLDRLNESIDLHKKSPVKSIPKSEGTPTKILYSPSKPRLKSLLGELAEKDGASTLELPLHYRRLEEMFHASDSMVGLCLDRGLQCTFSRLQVSVQTLINGKFEEQDMGRLKTVYPEAYTFSQQQETEEILVAPNFPPGSTATKLDLKTLLQRRRHFHLSLVPYVAIAHEEFLRQLEQPLVPLTRLTNWHPKFPLGEVADIPVSPLLQDGGVEVEKTYEFQATLPESAKSYSGIPSSILSKVRAKEAARALRIMQRSQEERRELQLLEGLHKLVPIIYNFLLMERKTSMWVEEICRRVLDSSSDFADNGLVEEHLQYLVRVLPHWLREMSLPGGGRCLKCVEGLPPLEDLLNHLTVVERTYFT